MALIAKCLDDTTRYSRHQPSVGLNSRPLNRDSRQNVYVSMARGRLRPQADSQSCVTRRALS